MQEIKNVESFYLNLKKEKIIEKDKSNKYSEQIASI